MATERKKLKKNLYEKEVKKLHSEKKKAKSFLTLLNFFFDITHPVT